MERKTSADFDQGLLNLFDQYVHGAIDRRRFLDEATRFAVGGLTAPMLLEMLSPKFAEAQQVAPTDDRLDTDYLAYPSPQGSETTRGYLARPKGANGALPGVLVVHENRGLNPHIEDITRRVALEDFIAFAPDALASLGGYPGDEDTARQRFGELDQTAIREDFVAAVGFLADRPDCTGRVGVVGFCYGGAIANMLATRLPDLRAAVPFYGSGPDLEDVANIKASLLIHHAEHDERINAAWPDYEAALKANNVRYERYEYPGTQHGFNNDTTPRYDEAAAALAWQRTIDFFNTHLRS